MVPRDRTAQTLALAAVLLVACGAPPRDDSAWSSPDKKPEDEPVGWIGETAVYYGEVGRYIHVREPDVFARNLTRFIIERLTRKEARPLGVTVPKAVLARETNRRMTEWERRVRAASKARTGSEVEPALWLQRVADLSLAEFTEMMREAAEVELLQDRLVRYEQQVAPHIEVSILVARDKATGATVVQELAAGADFAALAKRHSRDPSGKEGGRIAFPLLPADIVDVKVREALFAAQPGDVVGPFPAGTLGMVQIYRLESRAPARPASYGDLEREIEHGLETRPVAMGEYTRWRRRILSRHGFRAESRKNDPEKRS